MAFVIFILVICIFILFNNFYELKKQTNFIKSILEKNSEENASLRKEISEIKKELDSKTNATPLEEIKPIIEPIEEVQELPKETQIEEHQPYFAPILEEKMPKIEISKEEIPQIEAPQISTKSEVQVEQPIISYDSQAIPRVEKQTVSEENLKPLPIEESAFSKFMKSAEKQFADNWTGILGTAIMVLGIGYLSIYTALKVTPLFRILILWLYAGALIGSYYLLKKKEKWTTTGLWLRSAGASLFLFGCFGASQIPALTFISNSIAGYSLIAFGIALNLYVGYIIKKQTFLSLHVILSILILCVIPEKTLATIILAAITATIGILLSYKEKWEYHLLIVISSFLIFDIWFNAQGTKLSKTENIIAILGIVAVAISCLIMQYRKIYDNTQFDKSGFITHLTNWVLFATGLILHSTGSKFKIFVLFVGAICCLLIALKARKKNVYWLYHLDGMVAFILFSLSIIMLNDWNVGIDIIACVLYLVLLVCLFVVFKAKETLLHKIFLGINHLFGIGLLIFGVLLITLTLDHLKITNATVSLIVLGISALSIPIITSIKKDFSQVDSFFGAKSLSLNGVLAMMLSILIVIQCNTVLIYNSFIYVLIGIAIIWSLLKKKFDTPTFDIGRMLFFILTLFFGLFIIKIEEKTYYDWTFATGITTVIILNWTTKNFFKNDFIIRFLAIIGFNALLLLLTYKYLPSYQILQIITLFIIAILNHEFLWINFKKKSLTTDNQTLLYIFYYFFITIGSLLLLYRTFDFTTIEIALTCSLISVIELYILFAKRVRNKSDDEIKEWTNFNFLNSEFILLNLIVLGCSCVELNFLSLYFGGLAVVTFILFQKFEEFKRYNNYSFIMLLSSSLLTIYVTINDYYEETKTIIYIIQTVTILISVVYSYLQLKATSEKAKRYIAALPYIQNLWIIILLFIQVDLAYLPLLFIALAFVNFVLITKEKIKIEIHIVSAIASLAIVISSYYSFDKLNLFTTADWLLQLSSVAAALGLAMVLNKKETDESIRNNYQIVLNIWLSIIMFTQLEHKWLPVFWATTAIINLYLYHKKISQEKKISIVYYLLANIHLGFLSFNFYQSKFLAIYLLIFLLLAVYIYLASKWIANFATKNSILIYPATLSIGCFLFLTFDKGILTFFWILEALGLLILGIILKEKYFRYVSLSLVGVCIIRLMFFDLSNSDFLIRALVLLGVGVVLLVMNSLFKKYKDRFD